MALGNAFDKSAIDQMLFLENAQSQDLAVSGDGVLEFTSLIGAGFATFGMKLRDPMKGIYLYSIRLTEKGSNLLEAWRSGNRTALNSTLETG